MANTLVTQNLTLSCPGGVEKNCAQLYMNGSRSCQIVKQIFKKKLKSEEDSDSDSEEFEPEDYTLDKNIDVPDYLFDCTLLDINHCIQFQATQ